MYECRDWKIVFGHFLEIKISRDISSDISRHISRDKPPTVFMECHEKWCRSDFKSGSK
jgi:hypothetical protein